MKRLVLKYRLSYLGSIAYSLLTFCVSIGSLFVVGFLVFSAFGQGVSDLLKDSFLSGLVLTVITSVIAYITYHVQSKQSKKKSNSKEYYEKVVVPLFLELKKEKACVEDGEFDPLRRKLVEKLSEIDFEYFIPKYLKKELEVYDRALSTIIDLHEELNSLFYEKALPLERNNTVGLLNCSYTDHLRMYIKDKNKVFTYSSDDGSEFNKINQIRLNKIMLAKMDGVPLFLEFKNNLNILNGTIAHLNGYFVFMIKKSINTVI